MDLRNTGRRIFTARASTETQQDAARTVPYQALLSKESFRYGGALDGELGRFFAKNSSVNDRENFVKKLIEENNSAHQMNAANNLLGASKKLENPKEEQELAVKLLMNVALDPGSSWNDSAINEIGPFLNQEERLALLRRVSKIPEHSYQKQADRLLTGKAYQRIVHQSGGEPAESETVMPEWPPLWKNLPQ